MISFSLTFHSECGLLEKHYANRQHLLLQLRQREHGSRSDILYANRIRKFPVTLDLIGPAMPRFCGLFN